MTQTHFAPELVEIAVKTAAANLPERFAHSSDWRLLGEKDLWRELIAAILGSAVSYDISLHAVHALEQNDLLLPNLGVGAKRSIEACLRRAGYRFPTLRAAHICSSFENIVAQTTTLQCFLEMHPESTSTRSALVRHCPGLGPKQASLFLRNIGFFDFAVLDRHVLSYLVITRRLSKVTLISSLKKYEEIESSMREDASRLALNLAQFDLAVWVAMKTISGQRRWAS